MISRPQVLLFVNKLLSVSISTAIILLLLLTLSLLYRPLVNLESSPSRHTLSVCLFFFVRLSLHLYILLSVRPYPCISLCQSLYPFPLLQSNTNAFLRPCSAWISSVRPNQVKSNFCYPVL